MARNDEGSCTWTYTRRLYCEWGNLRACLKAFAIAIAICFVLITIGCAFIDSDFLGTLKMQSKIWGIILLGFELLAILAYYVWAWAQGGLDEWEYSMTACRLTGHKIVHKAWRMKVLRAFAWVLMLAPARPSQKMAMRQLLYDNTQNKVDIWFCDVKEISGNEMKGAIVFETKNDKKEIGVPLEKYAEIFAYVTENVQPLKPKRKNSLKKEIGNEKYH